MDLSISEKKLEPRRNPARIPHQTPPAGGKTAEARRIHSPRQIVSPCLVRISIFNHLDFARNSFELRPKNTALGVWSYFCYNGAYEKIIAGSGSINSKFIRVHGWRGVRTESTSRVALGWPDAGKPPLLFGPFWRRRATTFCL